MLRYLLRAPETWAVAVGMAIGFGLSRAAAYVGST